MSEQTLLEKAKSFKPPVNSHEKFSDEYVELAVAFLNGEVSNSQVKRAIDKERAGSSYIYRIGIAIRTAIADGRLEPITFKREAK
jgi:hypothetical protein